MPRVSLSAKRNESDSLPSPSAIKTMHFHFGPGVDLYGGRKDFTDLMIAKGHTLENISIWMGHSSLDRTWRSYKAKARFHL